MDEERVQILALEYQTLRADLQTRSAARFQFLGFVTAAAAILATGLGHSTGPTTYVLEILGALLFIVGVISFWLQGKDQARISAHIVEIERRINQLVPSQPNLLTWETRHQERSRFDRWILGLRYPSPKRKPKKTDRASVSR
jgi:hypothetical protein